MPSVEFNEELGRLPAGELADVLTRYVREAYPKNMLEAAKTISDAVYRAVPQDGTMEEKPRLLRVADFMAEIGDPIPCVVDGILPAQKLVVFSGQAKEGKSLVALEFLDRVATGQALMGRFPINQPGAVAYFGLEDGGHEIKARLTQRGVTDLSNFYVCWISFDMFAPGGFSTFQDLIAEMETPPALVVIDTAREAFRSIGDWNDPSQVGEAISPFRRWAQGNCSVMIVTHNNKNAFASGVNRISGSGALVSSADCYMMLLNKMVQENGNLRWDLEMGGRGLKQSEYVLEMDTNTLHVHALDEAEVKQAKAQTAAEVRQWTRLAIGRFIGEHGDTSVAQLAEALKCQLPFVNKLMNEMISNGHVAKTGRTQKGEGAGRPKPLYELTEAGRELFISGHCPTQYAEIINSGEANDLPGAGGEEADLTLELDS